MRAVIAVTRLLLRSSRLTSSSYFKPLDLGRVAYEAALYSAAAHSSAPTVAMINRIAIGLLRYCLAYLAELDHRRNVRRTKPAIADPQDLAAEKKYVAKRLIYRRTLSHLHLLALRLMVNWKELGARKHLIGDSEHMKVVEEQRRALLMAISNRLNNFDDVKPVPPPVTEEKPRRVIGARRKSLAF